MSDLLEARKTNPYLAGISGLNPGEERYIAKAQGLVGFEIFADDKISIKNLEGKQTCEVVVFDKKGNSNPSVINHQGNGDAKFIKYVLTNSYDKKFLLSKLKKRNIDFNNSNSVNYFNQETESDETKFVTIDQYSDNIESNKVEADKVKSDVDFIGTDTPS